MIDEKTLEHGGGAVLRKCQNIIVVRNPLSVGAAPNVFDHFRA